MTVTTPEHLVGLYFCCLHLACGNVVFSHFSLTQSGKAGLELEGIYNTLTRGKGGKKRCGRNRSRTNYSQSADKQLTLTKHHTITTSF